MEQSNEHTNQNTDSADTGGSSRGHNEYPEGYNPYQAQKKRVKKAVKQLKDAQNNFLLMSQTYEDFENDKHAVGAQAIASTIDELILTIRTFFTEFEHKD